MPQQRIRELETLLQFAHENIAELTKANVGLTESLKSAEASAKRARRNARQDGNTLREEISVLQQRRL